MAEIQYNREFLEHQDNMDRDIRIAAEILFNNELLEYQENKEKEKVSMNKSTDFNLRVKIFKDICDGLDYEEITELINTVIPFEHEVITEERRTIKIKKKER